MYGSSYMFRHYIAILKDVCLVAWCLHRATRHNTPIHNILSTAPQLSISQKAQGTLPEDGNVMAKQAEWIIGVFVGFTRVFFYWGF
jgi:cyanate permease